MRRFRAINWDADCFNSFRSYRRKPVAERVKDLHESIRQFELKYGMSSSDFLGKYRSGSLPNTHDFYIWADKYETYLEVSNYLSTKDGPRC